MVPEHDAFKQQLYHQMDRKETEELLAIWRKNDREAWTAEVFEAIHTVLL